MASVNRGISTWRSFSAIVLSFFAGSIVLSLLPTPETSFTALAQLVDATSLADDSDATLNTAVREVGYFVNARKEANAVT